MQVVVDGDDAVRALARGGGRAHRQAGRFVAMLAADRDEGALHVGELARFHVEHAAPLHARRRGVGVLAGRRAGLAGSRSGDRRVSHRAHGSPAAIVPPRLAHAHAHRSAPEPVASVRSSDMPASAFRLGTPKSLASGVAQWPNWPIASTVSGRTPWRSTARPDTLRCGVAISIGRRRRCRVRARSPC